MSAALPATHRRRLQQMWRSAGWPRHDAVESDLLDAGLLHRRWDAGAHESVRVTDAGLRCLARARQAQRAARSRHEILKARVVRDMQRAGRIGWRGLRLRAPLPRPDGGTRWVLAMPDVFSVRHTTVPACPVPAVHEFKVRRADLQGGLRRPEKTPAYAALAGECWSALREGFGQADELPAAYGVMLALARGLDVVRVAPRRPCPSTFGVWTAQARAHAEPGPCDGRRGLGDDGAGEDLPRC